MKSWAWAAVGLLIGAGSVMGSACGSSSGTGGGGGTNAGGGGGNGGTTATVNPTTSTTSTGGGTADCGALLGSFTPPETTNPAMTSAACIACFAKNANCCAAEKACDAGSDCSNLLACYSGGTMTPDQCNTMFKTGLADYNAFNACLGGTCVASCGSLACPADLVRPGTQSATDEAGQLCDQCIGGKCCDEWTKVTDAYITQNCQTDTTCALQTDLQACELDLTSAACKADAVALAAVTCEQQTCGVGGDPSKTDAFCAVAICDSGIIEAGGGTCAACLGTNCCTEYEALMCTAADANMPGSQCTVDLNALNKLCTKTDHTCGDNADAAAVATCQNTHCSMQCPDAFTDTGAGGGAGGN